VFAVDTNLFIYGHFDLYPQHAKARAFCQRLLDAASEEWCVAWQVVYEYVRITTHPAIHKVPLSLRQALADMDVYLSAARGQLISHTGQHRPMLEATAHTIPEARGNFIHDLHYAALLREHGVSRIYTADSDFKKFGFLEVIDPTV
jgi:predicted nucleic acid-binding protein